MHYQMIGYWAAKPGISIPDTRNALPESIQSKLLGGDRLKFGIYIEADQHALEKEIDAYLKIGKVDRFTKCRCAEVSKKEIGLYDYYRAGFGQLGEGKQIVYEYHSVNLDAFVASIKVKKSFTKTQFIYEVFCPFANTCLLISPALKQIFDQSGIEGLQYHMLPESSIYVGVVEQKISCLGDSIVKETTDGFRLNEIAAPYVLNLRYPLSRLQQTDFQDVSYLEVGKKNYNYVSPLCVISRKVIQIFLEQRVHGLRLVTLRLNEKFSPIIVDKNS